MSQSFQASDAPGASITQIRQVPNTALLVTVAEDLSNEPTLKVWALDKIEKKTGGPKCLCTINIQNQRKLFPISAFVVLDDLSQVAVGFANGAVTVIRGDLIHDRGTKQRTVFESEDPITALEVREGSTTVLFVATTGRICSLVVSGKGQGQQVRGVDTQGCGVGCMTLDNETKDIIIARDDAIYYYGSKGRGPSFAFEGPKKLVRMYKDYVGLLCPPRIAQLSKSKTFRRLGGNDVDELMSSTSFTLLDTDLRYIAHTESLPTQVKELFVEWGELFLLTLDGKLYRYQEKTLQQKLEILYQQNLYILAINIAQKSGVDTMQQNIIFRRYGDFLYQKGDYDTAMQQYLRAIDNTEPSQVIRKFLDTQRIHNLIEYLEELHEHGRATADHTTLLLNCYAKLKDTEKLDAFVKAPGEIKFDLDTAIAMCRQGGYFEQAAYLARKHNEHELVIDILIEDSREYTAALNYMWRLPAEGVYPNLMKYARVLIAHCPKDTTALFIQYYTGKYTPQKDFVAMPEVQHENIGALANLSALLPLPYMNRSAVASPGATAEQDAIVADAQLTSEENDILAYPVPAPRTAFSSFIAHPNEFITFLEALVSQPDLVAKDRIDLCTTLFELYLETANSPTTATGEKAEWQAKAKALIVTAGAAPNIDPSIDSSNVLLLSSLTKFPAGTTLVRERAAAYADIFRAHTAAKDTPGAISALQRYGPEDLSLYPLALSYFTSSSAILNDFGVQDLLQEILRRIDNENLMAPLQVVKVLSQGEAVTMGMIKDYLSDNIARERKEIQSNRKLIDSYRTETAAKKAELEDLTTKPVVFQSRRCANCGGTLDLPTVHFLCKHSFHQRCLNSSGMGREDEKAECPLCKPQHDTIKAIRRAQVENTDHHDLFRSALARSTDRFGTVSEFFGRGVMGTRVE